MAGTFTLSQTFGSRCDTGLRDLAVGLSPYPLLTTKHCPGVQDRGFNDSVDLKEKCSVGVWRMVHVLVLTSIFMLSSSPFVPLATPNCDPRRSNMSSKLVLLVFLSTEFSSVDCRTPTGRRKSSSEQCTDVYDMWAQQGSISCKTQH